MLHRRSNISFSGYHHSLRAHETLFSSPIIARGE